MLTFSKKKNLYIFEIFFTSLSNKVIFYKTVLHTKLLFKNVSSFLATFIGLQDGEDQKTAMSYCNPFTLL